MKRRFVSTTKEITEQKEDIATLGDREKELHDTIQALQKDITVAEAPPLETILTLFSFPP
jgi:hypothetical protein